MLSLAQLQNQQNFADGSYWQTNGGQPTANWSSGQIGQGAGINCTPGPNCYYRYYSAGATNVAGFQSYPADSSKVITYPALAMRKKMMASPCIINCTHFNAVG
jgi:hypothetical protein